MLTNETIRTMLARRSVRGYEPTPLTNEEVETLLECGNWAPSAMNHQTTTMVATQDAALIEAIAADFGGNFHYKAPCLIFLFSKDDGSRWTDFNAALVAENICLAAQSLGLSTVQLGCIYNMMNDEKGLVWKEKMGIDATDTFRLAVAVGHGAVTPNAPARKEETKKRI